MNNALGAQLYTVHEYTKTPADIAATFAKVADIGYRSVQASGMGPIDAAELAKISRDTGIEIALTHTPLERILHDTEAVMREHATFGCKIVGLGWIPIEMRDTKEHLLTAIETLNRAAKTLYQNGFLFSYHNHAIEFCKVDGKTVMDYFLEYTDSREFKLTIDPYWVQYGGVNTVELIEKAKDRTLVLHLKDMVPTIDNTVEFAEVGRGNLNYHAIIETAKKHGCQWYMVEQDVCKGNPFDSLKISFDYITSQSLIP